MAHALTLASSNIAPGSLLAILVLFSFFALPVRGQQVPDPASILGPPPGSPGFAEHQRRQDQQAQIDGFIAVSEELVRAREYERLARPLSEVAKQLAFTPTSLQSTPFVQLQLLGASVDDVASGGAVALHRTFRSPSSNVIDLFEWDMSVAGGATFPDASRQTERVNGIPAQLTVIQAPSGRAASTLSWVEGRREYRLTVDANVRKTNVTPGLLELANSIPKSIPARTTEPPFPGFPPNIPMTIDMPRR